MAVFKFSLFTIILAQNYSVGYQTLYCNIKGMFKNSSWLLLILGLSLISFVSKSQVLITSTGLSNSFSVNFPGNLGSTVPAGLQVNFFSNQSISSASTLLINGIGIPKPIYKNTNQTLSANDILAGQAVSVIYDGTNWQLLSSPSSNSASQWVNYTSGTVSGIYYSGLASVGAQPSGSYQFEVTGRIKSNGINETSDARFKKDIVTLDNALGKVLQLRGVTYAWRTSEFPQKEFSVRPQIGLIAQELEKVYPELVETDKLGYKSVEYSKLVAVLIEAIKEQQKLIETQKNEIEGLKVSIEKLQSLESQIKSLSESFLLYSGSQVKK
jgi:hypothetical protein